MDKNKDNAELVMGTRGSALALAQSRLFAASLLAAHPGLRIDERVIRTTGDRQQGADLPAIGGKGVFTLEIEQALLDGSIDFAVHSLKDLPPHLPEGLEIACVPRRESPEDVCVLSPAGAARESGVEPWPFLANGARVGTSSIRRRALLLHWRPDLTVEPLRGNIDTRLNKLQEQGFDAIVLARAGLERLALDFAARGVTLQTLEADTFVPAPGQGALAIEARAGDGRMKTLLGAVEDAAACAEIVAERAVMSRLEAGCTTPLGVLARCRDGKLSVLAALLSPDGRLRVVAEARGPADDADALGHSVARRLLGGGGREILNGLAARS